MSRISSDSVQVLHEPVTWLDVIPEALAGVPEGAVRVDLAPNLPPMDADRGLLERALANIVENAVRYAPGQTSWCRQRPAPVCRSGRMAVPLVSWSAELKDFE